MAPLGKKWLAGVTPESVVRDPELIRCMKDAGCISLFYGFESISNRYIETLNNPQKKVESYEKCIKVTKDAGIIPDVSFIIGSDYDDSSVFDDVLGFVEKNKIPIVTIHMLTPFPGTKLYHRMKKEGRILECDFRKYDMDTVVFRPNLMKPEELQEGYNNFLKEVYSFTGFTRRISDKTTLQHPWIIPANLGYAIAL